MLTFRLSLQMNGVPAASVSNYYMQHVWRNRPLALLISLSSQTQWCAQGFWEAADDNIDARA